MGNSSADARHKAIAASCLAILTWLTQSSLAAADSIRDAFPEAYSRAIAYIEKYGDELAASVSSQGASPDLTVPVVFPEILRYSSAENALESFALKMLYVSQGSSVCDYSIGLFQMKPSFAEALDARIQKDSALGGGDLFAAEVLGTGDALAGRARRLRRLSSMEGQIAYLSAFFKVVLKDHHAALSALDDEGKIQFLAAAYNAGFWLEPDRFLHAAQVSPFPNKGDHRFRFTAVALEFYRSYWLDRCRDRQTRRNGGARPVISWQVPRAAWPSNLSSSCTGP